jgi:hypothetical protein
MFFFQVTSGCCCDRMIVGFTSIYVFCNEIPITNYVCDFEACGTSWRVKCIDFCILFEVTAGCRHDHLVVGLTSI